MSSEKMGRFISELRKSRQMTQKDLAIKLNVTDKAVSKWERGLSYPDISLLSPLAKELGITPGELLNGEKDTNVESKAEANTAIDNVLQYAENAVKTKTKSTRRRAVFAVVGAVMLFMGLSLIFGPAVSRQRVARARTRLVVEYNTTVAGMSQAEITAHFHRAEEHNAALRGLRPPSPLSVAYMAALPDDYWEILSIDGVMGRVEIPAIGVDMPICTETYNVLFENKLPSDAISNLMSRGRKSEDSTGEERWVLDS